MTSLYQQLAMSYDAENTTAESLERAEQQRDPLQLQQQLERDPTLQLPPHMDLDPLQLQTQQERDQLQHQQQRDSLQLQQQRDSLQLQQQRDSLQLQQQRDPLQLQQQRDSLQLQQQRDSLQLQQQRDPLQLQQQRDSLQLQRDALQMQQRRAEREQLHQQREREQQYLQHREKIQMHQREHINQLQSINNLLLDLPPSATKNSFHSNRARESACSPTVKASNPEAQDMSILDLFGLSLPRGSLMGSQSSIGSSNYRQQCNGQNHGQNHGHASSQLNYPQYDEAHGCCPSSPSIEMPGTPNSATTPGSPSTPGSVYSNPYTYSNSGASSNGYPAQSPSNRSHYNVGSPSSSGHSPYYGRPIRGSPAYSDCGSPTLDYPHMLGFGGSRSNSPADSETSGYNSVDGSLSDIMNCLSLNSSGHSCYPPSLGALMPPNLDFYHGENRAAAYQRMAIKKYHQQQQQQQQQQQYSNMRHYHCCSSGNHVLPITKAPNVLEPYISLDRAARYHRNAAALCEATCTWSGELPKRTAKSSGYSSKVFLGGVPWDVTESLLVSTFKQFGPIRVEWPGKEQPESQPKGYAYIILESEKQVKSLLSCCTHRFGDEKSWYYKITPKRSKPKDVQVIPWHISDSNYSKSSSQKLDPEKTVFVGALHGMLTAEGLAKVMNDLFDEVIYAGIDTDKWKYPIGSARVTFGSKRSYKKACATAFVEIKTSLFTKKVQIDPYIEDSVCSACAVQHGPYFCREPICSRYFCRNCWHWQHDSEPMRHHQPMSRGSKTNAIVSLGHHSGMNFGNRSLWGSMI